MVADNPRKVELSDAEHRILIPVVGKLKEQLEFGCWPVGSKSSIHDPVEFS